MPDALAKRLVAELKWPADTEGSSLRDKQVLIDSVYFSITLPSRLLTVRGTPLARRQAGSTPVLQVLQLYQLLRDFTSKSLLETASLLRFVKPKPH